MQVSSWDNRDFTNGIFFPQSSPPQLVVMVLQVSWGGGLGTRPVGTRTSESKHSNSYIIQSWLHLFSYCMHRST